VGGRTKSVCCSIIIAFHRSYMCCHGTGHNIHRIVTALLLKFAGVQSFYRLRSRWSSHLSVVDKSTFTNIIGEATQAHTQARTSACVPGQEDHNRHSSPSTFCSMAVHNAICQSLKKLGNDVKESRKGKIVGQLRHLVAKL